MSRVGAPRLFWIGAATTLVAAALVSLAAVLGGHFDSTDGKILGSLGTLLLGGIVVTVGTSLRESYRSAGLGLTLAAGSPILTLVALAAIWEGLDSSGVAKSAGVAYVLLATGVVVGTARILAKEYQQFLFTVAAGASSLAALLAIVAIVGGSGADWKALVAILIIAVLAYALIPVSRRLAAKPSGAEPARIDLSTGVAVAGVRVRSADSATTLGSETVVIVLGGRATAGSAVADPGEAILAPAGTTLDPGPGGRVLLVGR
jgi:hypothetical protein